MNNQHSIALVASSGNAEAACTRYEDRKKSYKDTALVCAEQGLTFVPMVLEAVGGGWGKEARKVWSELAKLSAHAAGELETESGSAISFLQRFAVVLHRENARAVLRRLSGGTQQSSLETAVEAAKDN